MFKIGEGPKKEKNYLRRMRIEVIMIIIFRDVSDIVNETMLQNYSML